MVKRHKGSTKNLTGKPVFFFPAAPVGEQPKPNRPAGRRQRQQSGPERAPAEAARLHHFPRPRGRLFLHGYPAARYGPRVGRFRGRGGTFFGFGGRGRLAPRAKPDAARGGVIGHRSGNPGFINSQRIASHNPRQRGRSVDGRAGGYVQRRFHPFDAGNRFGCFGAGGGVPTRIRNRGRTGGGYSLRRPEYRTTGQ